MIAALLLAAAAAVAPTSQAMPATIAEVWHDPRHWDGKWVRLEGWINRCWSTNCSLAEKLAARPINQGKTLSFEGQNSFDAWIKPMLPLHATVVARVDATCLIGVCLDRAPELRDMIVTPIQTNAKFPDEDQ